MSSRLIDKVESAHRRKLPEFEIGDTVEVHVRIIEGEKQRVQVFTGTVIARRGGGMGETFTVRRIVNEEGVERTWPVHCPSIVTVKVRRRAKVRRAKLYFLRQRKGKATRLRERRVVRKDRAKQGPAAAKSSRSAAEQAPVEATA